MVTLVNGRVVRNSEINKTINDAYHSYKPDTRYPIVVINIELDPSLVDVNIHPTKMDVKFSKIEELKTLIYNLIRHELEKGTFIPDAVESDENTSITVTPDTERNVDTVRKPVYVEQKISFDMINDDSDEYVLISDSDSSNSELFKTDDFYKTEDSKENLTRNELKILTYLLENKGTIVSRDDLINYLWDSDEYIDDNTLTVNINRLRTKLASLGLKDVIITKRSQGYIIL